MDPEGKAPAPTPPYSQDAQKGDLPSVPFPHAGPEPSGQAPRSFLKGNSLDSAAAQVDVVTVYYVYVYLGVILRGDDLIREIDSILRK